MTDAFHELVQVLITTASTDCMQNGKYTKYVLNVQLTQKRDDLAPVELQSNNYSITCGWGS